MEVKFKQLKKKNKAVAEEFMEELELLPIFLNYYKDVQDKWLRKIGLTVKDIATTDKVVDYYYTKKVELEARLLPRTRKQVIQLENKVLKNMFIGRILSSSILNPKVIKAVILEEFPDAAVIGPEELRKIELMSLFKQHKKRFPLNFLVFDKDSFKIVGYEVIKIESKGEKNDNSKKGRR